MNATYLMKIIQLIFLEKLDGRKEYIAQNANHHILKKEDHKEEYTDTNVKNVEITSTTLQTQYSTKVKYP